MLQTNTNIPNVRPLPPPPPLSDIKCSAFFACKRLDSDTKLTLLSQYIQITNKYLKQMFLLYFYTFGYLMVNIYLKINIMYIKTYDIVTHITYLGDIYLAIQKYN